MNIYTNEDWIMRPEIVARDITGEGVTVGNDIYFYFKMCIYEQGVFDRLAKTPDTTLADEIQKDSGYLMVGNPEKIRAQLHQWVDAAINTTLEQRNGKK